MAHIEAGKSKSDEWCNCQDAASWHPLGDTPWCSLVSHGPECCADCKAANPTHRINMQSCRCD